MKHELKKLAREARSTPSDLANQVLYDLCREHPGHHEPAAIYAKILLIGRSHAAAIERRRKFLKLLNDEFYEKKVVPAIRAEPVDKWLCEVAAAPGIDWNSLPLILAAHAKVVRLFARISGRNQRSLASKYLHFHLPGHFFLYDTRAVQALGCLKQVIGKHLVVEPNVSHDIEYERLVRKCLKLQGEAIKLGIPPLAPRHVDNLLLKVHALGAKSCASKARKRGK